MDYNSDINIDKNKQICLIGNVIYLCALLVCVVLGTILRMRFDVNIVCLLVCVIVYSLIMSKIDGDFDVIRNRNLLLCAGAVKIVMIIGVIFESTLWGTDGANHKYDHLYYLIMIIFFIVQMIEVYMFIRNNAAKSNRKFVILESLVSFVLFIILDNSIWGFLLIVPVLTVLAQSEDKKIVKFVGICSCVTVGIASYTQLYFFISNNEGKTGIFQMMGYILEGTILDVSKYTFFKYVTVFFLLVVHFFAVLEVINIVKRFNDLRMDQIKLEEKKVRGIIDDIQGVDLKLEEKTNDVMDNMKDLKESIDENRTNLEQLLKDMSNSIDEIKSQTENIDIISNLISNFSTNIKAVSDVTYNLYVELEGSRNDFTRLKANSITMNNNNKEAMLVIKEFVEHVENVKEITKGIENIAEETNLLSINASIKSSKAGDAGEAFVVLSKEIYNLAEETNALTSSIHNSIKDIESYTVDIREELGQVVLSVDGNKQVLDESIVEFENMEQYMDNVREEISAINGMVREIDLFKQTIEEKIETLYNSNQVMNKHTMKAKEINDKNIDFMEDTNELLKNISLQCSDLEKICNE